MSRTWLTKETTMIRRSTAVWRGHAVRGTGSLTTQSGALHKQTYSFETRLQSEDGKAGTNPEELLAAAHAGCHAMALAFCLGYAGHPSPEVNVTASAKLL
jgi:osmotically inducible protein OsmC